MEPLKIGWVNMKLGGAAAYICKYTIDIRDYVTGIGNGRDF